MFFSVFLFRWYAMRKQEIERRLAGQSFPVSRALSVSDGRARLGSLSRSFWPENEEQAFRRTQLACGEKSGRALMEFETSSAISTARPTREVRIGKFVASTQTVLSQRVIGFLIPLETTRDPLGQASRRTLSRGCAWTSAPPQAPPTAPTHEVRFVEIWSSTQAASHCRGTHSPQKQGSA